MTQALGEGAVDALRVKFRWRFGQARDIANAVLFLASESNRLHHRQVLGVNGGMDIKLPNVFIGIVMCGKNLWKYMGVILQRI